MNNLLLDVLSFGAMLSGILVITSNNPVISVLFLISVFLNVAGYLILLGITYLGLVYIIVYVGAIAILFLFIIMMLNIRLVELLDTGAQYTKSLPLGTALGALFLFEIMSISNLNSTSLMNLPLYGFNFVNELLLGKTPSAISDVHTAYAPISPETGFASFNQIESIGQGLYTYSTLWLVIASVILLLSMVGPIILCMTPTHRHVSTDSPLFSTGGFMVLMFFFFFAKPQTHKLHNSIYALCHRSKSNREISNSQSIIRFMVKTQTATYIPLQYGLRCCSIYAGTRCRNGNYVRTI